MSINYPPQYRYSLFDDWDKEAFEYIKRVGKTKQFPKLIGTTEDKNQFLVTLIRTQKSLHDWRGSLVDMLEQIKLNNTIDTQVLNEKYPPESISKDEPDWVTYEEDRIVSRFIDGLETRKIIFNGSDEEISEFITRFFLGQLGHDWEWTIMMIWELLGKDSEIDVKELNDEMKNFDYLHLLVD
jgi:hypothetical protein